MGAPAGLTRLRLVLDTNLLVSALALNSRHTVWLRFAWQRDAFVPLVSSATVQELNRVLAYPKFGLDPAKRGDLLADYLPWCETVAAVPQSAISAMLRDPTDRPFLDLAIVAKADALITGDADLLELRDKAPAPIWTAAELFDRLGAS